MKRLFLSSLICVSLFALVGCGSVATNGTPIGDEVVGVTLEQEDSVFEKFSATIPNMKKILEENKVNYQVVKAIFPDNRYNGCESLNLSSTENKPGVSSLDYTLALNSENLAYGYRIVLSYNLTDEEKAGNVDLGNTVIAKISSELVGESVNYAETNTKINDMLKAAQSPEPQELDENGSEKIEDRTIKNDYNGAKETIDVNGDSIFYSLVIPAVK